jgi:hypothetical protein
MVYLHWPFDVAIDQSYLAAAEGDFPVVEGGFGVELSHSDE